MKFKTLRNVTLGIACLMMVLTLSVGTFNNSQNGTNHMIHPMEDSPVD